MGRVCEICGSVEEELEDADEEYLALLFLCDRCRSERERSDA